MDERIQSPHTMTQPFASYAAWSQSLNRFPNSCSAKRRAPCSWSRKTKLEEA